MLSRRVRRRKSIPGVMSDLRGGVFMKHMWVLAAFAALAMPAFGQQSAPRPGNDPLQEICSGFLQQGGQGVSGDRNRLCTCLVRETKSRLTEPEMKAYNRAAETGQAPPEAVMQKVMGIATTCLTEAAK
jgi:hypothetical protein